MRPTDLADVSAALAEFSKERDWQQFHSPKNLAVALSVEAAELLERFQWLSEDASRHLGPDDIARVAEELADVQIYLVILADALGIDLLDAVGTKIEKNRTRYPAELVRGSAGRQRP